MTVGAVMSEEGGADAPMTQHQAAVMDAVHVEWESFDQATQRRIRRWICTQADRFTSDFNPVGRTETEVHRIPVVPGAEPVAMPPRRLHPHLEDQVRDTVQQLLKVGTIRPSTSPWAAGVVMARKANGGFRMAIDYRRLNDVTIGDAYPMPRVDDALAAMQGASWFSAFDLTSGYWQVPVAEEDRAKTAFVTRDGLFEWNGMPFGLKCAPATFCRLMAKVLAGMSFVDCLVYMDDVLVFSQSVEQHFDRIDKVFERLREHGLTVNPKKTYLLQREVTYLGHRVSGDGIQPDARLVQAVTEFPEPTNKAQVRTFLGLAGYYSHLIRKFAEVSAPLSDLVGKASQWRWGEEESEAFRELRRRLSERPLLAHPDFSRPFILQTDWSNTAFGAILCQRDDVGHEHPVAYMSKKCRGAEKQYTSRRGEAVSIRLAVRKWRCFLEGAHFMIETDHRPLEFLRKEQDDAQLCRVWEALEPYDYTLRYKPGASMTNVDALSRVEYRHHPGEPVVDPDLVGQDSEESADEEDQDDDDDVPDVAEALGVQAINVNGRTRPCGRCLVRCIAGLKEAVPNGEADDAAGGPDLAGLRERQRSDPVLRRLIEAKERNEQPNSQLETTTLLDNNGILMKVVSAPRSGEQQRVVLFLPESDRSEQLRRAHDDPVAGHFGQARTVQNLRRTVFWPGMVRDARRYVERCRACQQAKARVPSAQGLRQEFDEDDVPFLPWYSVHVDHVVDLPRTSRGNEHVLTVTCRMCHATLFLPVRRYTAVETAETLIRHVFLQKGFPMKMTADRSRSWRNDLFEAIGKAFGFRLAMTVSYRARGNGMAERPHRYLKAFLRTMSDEDLARWDLQLEYLTFAYCKGVCETTKETPHYLEFGRDIRGPVEYDVQLPEKRVDRSYREYLQRLQRRLRSAWEVAHRMAKEAYGKRVARQNLGRFSPNPEVGQLFWADRRSQATAGEEGEPTRFRSPLTGPWRVLQKLPNTADTYRLRHLYTQEEATFNCDQIVRVFEGEEDGADDDADVDADLGIEEDGDSEVDPELAVLDELVLSAADISDVEDGDPTFAPEGRASTTPDRPQGEQSYNLRSRGGV